MYPENLSEELFELLKSVYYESQISDLTEFFQGELKLLNFLDTCGCESVTPSDISRRIGMSSARLAAALKNAEKKSFIMRAQNDNDKRSVSVTITPNGREYVKGKRNSLNSSFESYMSRLGEKDSREFVRIVKRLIDISREISKGEE